MSDSKRFAVFGDAGSFSEAAGVIYTQKAGITATFVYLPDMEDLLAAVVAGKADIGLFPVVNFRGGIVATAFEAMGKYSFSPIDSVKLNVQQCLIVKPGTKLKDITKIVSHPQALSQCDNYLKKEFGQAERVAWNDTAGAARDLAAGKLSPDCAALASEHAAKMYGLEVAAKSIQDDPDNYTMFIVVKKRAA